MDMTGYRGSDTILPLDCRDGHHIIRQVSKLRVGNHSNQIRARHDALPGLDQDFAADRHIDIGELRKPQVSATMALADALTDSDE